MKNSRVAMLVAGALVLGLALGGLSIASAATGSASVAPARFAWTAQPVTPSVPATSGAGVGTQAPNPPAVVNPPAAPSQQSQPANTVNRNQQCRTYSNAAAPTQCRTSSGYRSGMGSRSGNGSCGR